MDPRGLRTRLTGASCTACGAAIPVDRIAVLADRGDFAFVELRCDCGSRTMGLVLATPEGDPPILDTAAHPELDPATAARLASRPPIGEDDLLAMHRLLEGWTGDLRSLVNGDADGRTG
ncbi:MAG TPA: hypothetical protein VFL03_10070 [Candidatus Limnocylindrales bacterium]|jgi:hypothetical protein|nr:hypothetical protein [Candidatus Limnocylindrales bacterium]